MSEPPAEQHGSGLASPPPRARRLVFAAVTGLALAVALAAAGVIIASRQLPPRPVATLSGPVGQAPCSAAFSPDGTTLAVAGCGDSVALWDIATRRQVATLTSPLCPLAGQVLFSPNGRTLALFGGHAVSPTGRRYHPAACLWNMATRRETTLTDPPLLAATSAQGTFSPSGTTLAVADNSGNIYLWNLAARRVTATVPASSDCASSCPIAFSPDGTLLAVGQTVNSGTEPSGAHVYLWDLAARRWAGTLTAGKGPIGSLAFGRHGILAVGADDDHAYLWDVPARRMIGAIAPPINVAAGNASISKDGTPYPAPGTFDQGTTAAFSPDGATLAIDASFGYGTYLYHSATRNQVATLPYPACQYHVAAGLVFSPGGTMLAVGDTDPSHDCGHVYLWDVTRNRS
jgi:WD40 repeat protein